jgi:mRNA interferase RelE/StbE
MSRVQLIDEAKEDLRDLDGAARKMVLRALVKLETDPDKRGESLGNNTAIGNLTGLRKLVVGDRTYRIVYDVRDDGSIVVVWVIGRRVDSEAYALARARLDLYETDSTKKTALIALMEQVRIPTSGAMPLA